MLFIINSWGLSDRGAPPVALPGFAIPEAGTGGGYFSSGNICLIWKADPWVCREVYGSKGVVDPGGMPQGDPPPPSMGRPKSPG